MVLETISGWVESALGGDVGLLAGSIVLLAGIAVTFAGGVRAANQKKWLWLGGIFVSGPFAPITSLVYLNVADQKR